jgi:legumain
MASILIIAIIAWKIVFPKEVPEITDHWALLVAGSNGFVNYRHQADVCHAYHLLLDQGLLENQIIVMAFDDVVWDDENPV